ncbi:MAG: PIN domain-containing protein [Acidimicrobiales bacterium]
MLIADTSGLLAFFDGSEQEHSAVRAVVEAESEPMVVSPYVSAELDYLVATRVGVEAELAVLHELASGAYDLAMVDVELLERSAAVVERYPDQDIGVADASIVVLADQFGTRRILTLDRRHFDVVRPVRGGRFRCLP